MDRRDGDRRRRRMRGFASPLLVMGAALQHWSEWDDSTNVAGGIDLVNDKSGNGNTLTQALGANRPTFIASGIGGQGTGRFNGLAHFLQASWFPALSDGDDSSFSVTVVINKNDAISAGTIISSGDAVSNIPFIRTELDSVGALAIKRRDDGNNLGNVTAGSYVGGTDFIITFDFDGSNVRFFKNGVADGTGNSDLGVITTDTGLVGALQFGAIRTNFLLGDIAALIVNNREYQGTEEKAICNYLNDKYNVF